MKIYIAGIFSRRPELKAYAQIVEEVLSAKVTSSWLDLKDDDMTTRTQAENRRIAEQDIEDLKASDLMIFFAEEVTVSAGWRGGRHVEYGIAIGRGIPILHVGRVENIFGYTKNIIYTKDFSDAIDLLRENLAAIPVREPGAMTIDELIVETFATSIAKGWWEGELVMDTGGHLVEIPRQPGPALLLIQSEICEGFEHIRNNKKETEIFYTGEDKKPDGFPVELADAAIRIAEYSGGKKIPLARAIREKLAYNATRPHKHGGKAF